MKALVTRPREDAAEIAAALVARGLEPLIEPMLSIRFAENGNAIVEPLLEGAQAVLFTSANGVRAFAAATAHRDLPAYCVGDATAQAARDAGFADVSSAGGAVEDQAALVRQRLSPAGGALVHAAASEVAGDLAGALDGFELRRAVLYEAIPAERLSDAAIDAFGASEVAVALFFSPRTAATFVTLAGNAGIAQSCGNVAAVALSPAVADALAPIAWRAVRVAEQPNQEALLAALDQDTAPPPRMAPPSPPPSPPPPPPRRGRGVAASLLGALVLALVIVGSAPFWAPSLTKLLPWGGGDPSGSRIADLDERLKVAETARRDAETRLARLEQRPQQAPQAAGADSAALAQMSARIAALEQRGTAPNDTAALQSLKDELQRAASRLDTADARIDAIAARQEAAGTGDLKLLAALADLRAALAGSGPYEAELKSAVSLAGNDASALQPLAHDAAAGLPGAALLAARFRTETAPAIRRAVAPAASESSSFEDRVLARVRGLVSIRRVGAPAAGPGESPASPVETAQAALDKDDLAGAVAALKTLDGPSADAAAPWLALAGRRVAAEQAVASLARQVGARLAQSGSR